MFTRPRTTPSSGNPTVVVHDMAASAAANANSEGFFVLQGSTVTLTGIVQNVGNTTESNFQVNCTIQLVGGAVAYNQTQTVTTPLPPAAESTVTFTPSWTASTTGTYFFKITTILSSDLNPNNNLKTTEMHGFVPPGPLFYDDGTAEVPWDPLRDNDILANHFVPPFYPAFIDSVRYYVTPGSSTPHPFVAKVLDDDGPDGAPGTVLFTQPVNTPSGYQWYGATPNLIINSGGFYVGWQMQDSMALPLGIDYTLPQPISRQGWEFNGSVWSKVIFSEYCDLMIRARIVGSWWPFLDIALTPRNPPIVIPANGGSFSFNLSVQRAVGSQAPYAVWCRIKNPDGSYTNPTLGPVTINTPVGVIITRQRTQTVPRTWAAGSYTYLGYVNTTFSYPAYDSSLFSFTKSSSGNGGAAIWEASCSGEPFPGEEARAGQALPLQYGIVGIYPNPFNPTTALSFKLQAASYVSLKVYDTAGGLVATLVGGWREAGTHQITFDGTGLASGLYFVKLNVLTSGSGATPTMEVRKVVLLK
jgi:hypothetical protein